MASQGHKQTPCPLQRSCIKTTTRPLVMDVLYSSPEATPIERAGVHVGTSGRRISLLTLNPCSPVRLLHVLRQRVCQARFSTGNRVVQTSILSAVCGTTPPRLRCYGKAVSSARLDTPKVDPMPSVWHHSLVVVIQRADCSPSALRPLFLG